MTISGLRRTKGLIVAGSHPLGVHVNHCQVERPKDQWQEDSGGDDGPILVVTFVSTAVTPSRKRWDCTT